MKTNQHTIIYWVFVACALSLTANNSLAQPFVGQQKTVGGNLLDQFRTMTLTTDGGIFAGGYTASKKSYYKTEGKRGGNDYWVIKLNSAGQPEWDKTLGGNKSDELQSLQQTADGGYILAGSSLSPISGEKTEDNRGNYDMWIIKLNALGQVEWDKTLGGNKSDYAYSVKQTYDGGFMAGGFSTSGVSGDKTESNRGLSDYWVVKLNADGSVAWNKTIGGSGDDILLDLIETSDHNIVLGGHSSSPVSGDKTQNSKGDADYWIVKLDEHGNKLWDKVIGGNSTEIFAELVQTKDGGFVLGGTSISDISGDKSESIRGSFDYWVVKTDENGNVQWDKTIGADGEDYLNSIQQTTDSGYILVGDTRSGISGDKTESSRGDLDYWAVKLTKKGKFAWDKTIGGDGYDQAFEIQQKAPNRFVIGGLSGSGISGDKTQPTVDGDYWLVELQFNASGTAQAVAANQNIMNNRGVEDFSVFPNPAKNVLNIQTGKQSFLKLTDQAGRLIFTKQVTGLVAIDITQYAPGIYYLENIRSGSIKKIVITK